MSLLLFSPYNRSVPSKARQPRERIDLLLVRHGMAPSQPNAAALVLAGKVTADGIPVSKPGILVRAGAVIALTEPDKYVGRGGLKLEYALDSFGLDVKGKIAVDIGSSTGGFTDCLLKRGATRVYAVDVGKGQLEWKLRKDNRVVVLEGVNARNALPVSELVDVATIDVSFISVTRVIPPAFRLLKGEGRIVALVKPQFEAMRKEVGAGGVIHDAVIHARVLGRFLYWVVGQGYRFRGMVASPIYGASGNREFFVLLSA